MGPLCLFPLHWSSLHPLPLPLPHQLHLLYIWLSWRSTWLRKSSFLVWLRPRVATGRDEPETFPGSYTLPLRLSPEDPGAMPIECFSRDKYPNVYLNWYVLHWKRKETPNATSTLRQMTETPACLWGTAMFRGTPLT